MAKFFFLSVVFLFCHFLCSSQTVTISGTVTEANSGERVAYVNIVNTASQEGATSNAYGFYSINVKAKTRTEIVFTHVGYKKEIISIHCSADTVLNVKLENAITELNQVVVSSDENGDLSLSHQSISVSMIKDAPALLGEKDVFKTLQLLPGVQRGVEGSNNFYVRGGGADQNLVVVDEATVYNANHLFGFVSMFNPDAIRGVDFYKGTFPARYGGRISSVTDLQFKDGNKETAKASGGIGILSGRITVEGPVRKNQSSYLLSMRRSFIDLVMKPFASGDNKELYRFFDGCVKLHVELDRKNQLYLSGFAGGDRLYTRQTEKRQSSTIRSITDFGWKNYTGSVRYTHMLSKNIFTNTSVIYSHYNFFLKDDYKRSGLNQNYIFSEYNSGINDYTIKNDVDYFASAHHAIKAGVAFSIHSFTPRMFYSKDEAVQLDTRTSQKYQTRELNFYVEDKIQLSKALSANVGARMTRLAADVKNFTVLEPRAEIYYSFSSTVKLNGGYTRANQFMHLLSNTGVGLPTDLWVPVTAGAPPQQGDQVSIGATKTFLQNGITLSVESYRRYTRNIINYKPGASFLDTDEPGQQIRWEDNITVGKSQSYGTEVLVQNKTGKLTGWVGYTLAWAVHEFKAINNGNRFFPNYDSRHNVVVFANYKASEKIVISANWLYSSGRAINVPQAYYYAVFSPQIRNLPFRNADGNIDFFQTHDISRAPYSGSMNSFRGDAYHRLDLSIQFHRKKGNYERYWEFSLFNAYNRKNPYYYYMEQSNDFVNQGQRLDLKKKSLFPILPSVSYNFKF